MTNIGGSAVAETGACLPRRTVWLRPLLAAHGAPAAGHGDYGPAGCDAGGGEQVGAAPGAYGAQASRARAGAGAGPAVPDQ